MAITETKKTGIYKIDYTWASSSAGAASETTSYSYNAQPMRVIFDPDGGATQPTDQYDVVINDDDGYDILHGLGANLSNSANVYKTNSDGMGAFMSTKLTFSVSNAGDTKGGRIVLYLIPIDQRW